MVRLSEDVGVAGAATRFRAAAPAVWPRRSRQHVLRAPPCVVVLPPTVGKYRTDAESDDVN